MSKRTYLLRLEVLWKQYELEKICHFTSCKNHVILLPWYFFMKILTQFHLIKNTKVKIAKYKTRSDILSRKMTEMSNYNIFLWQNCHSKKIQWKFKWDCLLLSQIKAFIDPLQGKIFDLSIVIQSIQSAISFSWSSLMELQKPKSVLFWESCSMVRILPSVNGINLTLFSFLVSVAV